MFDHILVPVDFEPSDVDVPAVALALAEKHNAELHLLHIIPDRVLPRFGSRNKLATVRERVEQAAQSSSDITIHRTVQQGSVADSVVDYLKTTSIDLVFVDQGSNGITSERTFKQTVSRLLELTDCPVLVVRQAQSDESDLPQTTLRAAGVLRDRFGSHVAGDQESSRQAMHEALAQQLDLAPEEARQRLLDVERAGIVQWRGEGEDAQQTLRGTWVIEPTDDAPIDFAPDTIDVEQDHSAAMGLIRRAIASRATDIHIDPGKAGAYNVRFRIDGRVHEYCSMQGDVAGAMRKQLKVMANVSLADPFQPSESRLQLPASISNYEVRITTAPVVNGEAIALRIIDCDRLHRPLNELGLSPASFAAVYKMLHQRSGLVLIAGPTGAGKTTTAYSMLNVLFTDQQNIISIEDPVELLVPFMRQLSVDKRHGLTMDVALETVLRMDPDVLFVGEIRNSEAAHVAIQAAGCGKRAFSTMHMRDCSATVTAMRKLDIDAKTLVDNVSGIITQRLVRRLCPKCCEGTPITKYERELFVAYGIESPASVMQPRGCEACRNTGYKERIGIFEAAIVEGRVADGIRQDLSEGELRELIRQAGTPDFIADGLAKVCEGVTSMQEIQEMNWLPVSTIAEPDDTPSETLYERGAPYKKAL